MWKMLDKNVLKADERGSFLFHQYEGFDCKEQYTAFNLPNVFRGLHTQIGQGKIVTCLYGSIYGYIVSPNREVYKYYLSQNSGSVIYVPPSWLHGYYSLEASVIHYMMDKEFDTKKYLSVSPNSITTIELPQNIIISDKDLKGMMYNDYTELVGGK